MSVRVLQISDNHWGITKEKHLRRELKKATEEDFDVIVHCGDYCGGTMGHKTVGATVRTIREYFPDKIYISVLGNHDFWCRKGMGRSSSRPQMEAFVKNLDRITECFKQHNVHFLDQDGVFLYKNVAFMGHSGWYTHPHPPTNDQFFLPIGLGGDTNRYLLKQANDTIYEQVDFLEIHPALADLEVVFVSHFPVIKAGPDYKGRFEDFSWAVGMGNFIQTCFDCKYFLNGHAHQLHQGPLRWECGPDYGAPTYQIVEIKNERK